MKKYNEVKQSEKVIKVISEVICNCCGKSIDKTDTGRFHDYLSVEKSWGYLSEFDCEVHKFDLCVDCYKNILDKFSVPAEIV
jgi:hypothetical protein